MHVLLLLLLLMMMMMFIFTAGEAIAVAGFCATFFLGCQLPSSLPAQTSSKRNPHHHPTSTPISYSTHRRLCGPRC
jgi:hypothetical protein